MVGSLVGVGRVCWEKWEGKLIREAGKCLVAVLVPRSQPCDSSPPVLAFSPGASTPRFWIGGRRGSGQLGGHWLGRVEGVRVCAWWGKWVMLGTVGLDTGGQRRAWGLKRQQRVGAPEA